MLLRDLNVFQNHMYSTHFEPFNHYQEFRNHCCSKVHCLRQPISFLRLKIIRLVHFPSERYWLTRAVYYTKYFETFERNELLEMYTKHTISKHLKISLASKVYYFMVLKLYGILNYIFVIWCMHSN